MKKTMKLFSIILIAMVIVSGMATISLAGGSGSGSDSSSTVDGLFEGGDANTEQLENVGASLVDIITTVGIIVAVIVLLIIGIKYLMGSASEKAEYKKTMIPYLVGAVIIFGASAIAKAVIAMSESIAGAAGG